MLVCVLVLLSTIHAITGQCISNNLRLQQTATLTALNSGRLEICRNGIWGSIRASSSISFWSEKNVLVACRQLGFNGGLNSVPPNQLIPADQMNAGSPVHYSNVICDGTETNITECRSDVTGTNLHNSDVYIVCLPGQIIYTDLHTTTTSSVGDVRLVGSTSNGRGAVEILARVGWSTICPDSNWEGSDARVICQNLGYESGQVETYTLDSPIIASRQLYDAECLSITQPQTSFTRITAGSCTFLQVRTGVNDCPFPDNMLAGVTCSTASQDDGSSRLIVHRELSTSRFQGVVEILYDGRWGVLCRPVNEDDVSSSLCEGFGYNRNGHSVLTISQDRLQSIESRLKPLWIPNIACTSSSDQLSECRLESPLGYGTCTDINADGFGDVLTLDCGSSLKEGLYPGEIAAIAISVIFILCCIGFLIYALDKNRYKTWQQKDWYKFLTDPKRWCVCNCCKRNSRNQVRGSGHHRPPPPTTTTSDVLREVVADSEPPEPPSEPTGLENSELTKPPPPSYGEAFNVHEELPPPYFIGIDPAYPPPIQSAYPPPTEIGLPYPTYVAS